jgi:aminoglycoside 3-N-acetyltransferase
MPAFDSNNTEPSQWKAPPVDPRWWPVVRAEQPAFDPATTPSIRMGALAEYFRTLPGTRRSHHPHVSWCGRGPLAEDLLRDCPLDYALGEDSPLGRTYERGGWVLSLGCRRTTVLHLAEHRCAWRGRAVLRQGSSMLVEGRRQWVEYELQTDENADFEALRQAYMLEQAAERGSTWHEAPCGYGQARLFAVRPLIDFAAGWLAAHRV